MAAIHKGHKYHRVAGVTAVIHLHNHGAVIFKREGDSDLFIDLVVEMAASAVWLFCGGVGVAIKSSMTDAAGSQAIMKIRLGYFGINAEIDFNSITQGARKVALAVTCQTVAGVHICLGWRIGGPAWDRRHRRTGRVAAEGRPDDFCV